MFRTPEFEAYIAPARKHPGFWLLVLGMVTALLAYLVPVIAIFGIMGAMVEFDQMDAVMMQIENPDTPVTMLLLLSTFIFMGLAAVLAAQWHDRGFASLIGPLKPALRDFIRAMSVCIIVFLVVGFASTFLTDDATVPNLPFGEWALYLPLALPLLLIQTGSEELLFRGYLMQQLAARFKSPLIWMILPAVLFAFGHFDPTKDPVLAILIVFATGLFGVAAADLTRITGNLGAAMGFHFANNFFALFLVAMAGEMSGLSLYLSPYTMEDVQVIIPFFIIDMLTIIFTWGLLRRWLLR